MLAISMRYLGARQIHLSQPKFFGLTKLLGTSVRQGHFFSHMGQPQLGYRQMILHLLRTVRSRFCMWKLRRALGNEFDEEEFKAGLRQVASHIIKAVREENWSGIRSCCTEQGSCAIYGLTRSQREDNYSKMVRFEPSHMVHIFPISVQIQKDDYRKYVYVDFAIVGLRDVRDFGTLVERKEMLQLMKALLHNTQISENIAPSHSRLVMGEFLITLRKQVNDLSREPQDWLVDFYMVYGFKLVNYSPFTLQYRIIEFLKPVRAQ